jgi:hypothetical protein
METLIGVHGLSTGGIDLRIHIKSYLYRLFQITSFSTRDR